MTPPRLAISHHVQRWHDRLVPDAPLVLLHRATGETRGATPELWAALTRLLREPRTLADCVEAVRAAGLVDGEAEVQALAAAKFLVDPERDYWDDYHPALATEARAPDLAVDRLRWSRDVIEPHELWLYPRWMGLPALQWPPDLWWMQQLVWETRPDAIVETGLYRGGTAAFYASVLELLGHGRVIGVELRLLPGVREAIAALPVARRIEIVEGDSADPAVRDAVATRLAGSDRVIVALDSRHDAEHVLAELQAYAPLVGRDGKIVVFDTSLSLVPHHLTSNPHLAVREFVRRHPEWRVSPWAGASFVTACEDGILERR